MPGPPDPDALGLAGRLAAGFAALPVVEAVALGGSLAAGGADGASDVDLYVYGAEPPPPAARAALAAAGGDALGLELDNRNFEPGDEWIDGQTGLAVDVMYRTPAWIEAELDRVLVRHEARLGYTTCFWANVRSSRALFDRSGWFAALQARAATPYPEPLRRAIVRKNLAVMARNQSSFLRQLERAAMRGDAVAVNHRLAAFLACAFDVLFAVNEVPHPGEKRLLAAAVLLCRRQPPGFLDDVGRLLATAADGTVAEAAGDVAEGLEWLAREEGLEGP
jgi:predicted nucleotidyltransferase